MSEPLDPTVDWFDTSGTWDYAIKRAVFFGGYCGQKTVVRWIPFYHRWYIGFRKREAHPRYAVYAGIRESIRQAADR